MEDFAQLAVLVARQAASTSPAISAATTGAITSTSGCQINNDYDGRLGLRISSIFVILVGSCFGAIFPVFAKNNRGVRVPEFAFFFAKYFGSGVILATAFIHLLAPANEALTDPCLTGGITEYSWCEGIVLITIFVLFFIELMAMRYSTFGHTHSHDDAPFPSNPDSDYSAGVPALRRALSNSTHTPGDDHLGHTREHDTHSSEEETKLGLSFEDYRAQMTAIFILEFGVIFHSIFVGLTLAVAGEGFPTLYIVLVFHQTFEGLGLGSRLAATPWPRSKKWTPYILAVAFGISTPIAIGIGLGVRKSYAPGSEISLITNGIFDSISAGILIYTGLVELLAHEFMFSEVMRKAPLSTVLSAFAYVCLGAALMALLGKWV